MAEKTDGMIWLMRSSRSSALFEKLNILQTCLFNEHMLPREDSVKEMVITACSV